MLHNVVSGTPAHRSLFKDGPRMTINQFYGKVSFGNRLVHEEKVKTMDILETI